MMTQEERKDGRRVTQRKYYERHREEIANKQKQKLLDDPESVRAIKAKYRKHNPEKLYQYILNNYEWYLFNSARNRARIHGIEFTITKEDIIIPTHCPYMGFELTRIQGKGRQKTNPSLDRIDSTKGYIPGNVEVISDLANRVKQDATIPQLRLFAEYVLKGKK